MTSSRWSFIPSLAISAWILAAPAASAKLCQQGRDYPASSTCQCPKGTQRARQWMGFTCEASRKAGVPKASAGKQGAPRASAGKQSAPRASAGKSSARKGSPGRATTESADGTLSQSDVDRTVAANSNALRSCVSVYRKVRLTVYVDASGKALEFTYARSDPDDARDLDCVKSVIQRARFPEPRGGAGVVIQFDVGLEPR